MQGKKSKGKSYRVREVQPGTGEGRMVELEFPVKKVGEFNVHGVSYQVKERPPGGNGSERTEFNVSIHVGRKSNYYLWKVCEQ